jgi:regulator of protease activity HflC (stomatin/prohibitin superfamily)
METQAVASPHVILAPPPPSSDLYRGVIFTLSISTFLGTVASIVGAVLFSNAFLLDVALTLGVSTLVLVGVAIAQAARAMTPTPDPVPLEEGYAENEEGTPAIPSEIAPPRRRSKLVGQILLSSTRVSRWMRALGPMGWLRMGTAMAGAFGILFLFRMDLQTRDMTVMVTVSLVAGCLISSGFAATTVHYLARVDHASFPEALGLCRGARLVAWILGVASCAEALSWLGQYSVVQGLHFAILVANAGVCYGLITAQQPKGQTAQVYPLDFGVLSLLGSRPNIIASIVDAAERQLGIDVRSTWALTVVRQSLIPLVAGLCFAGWLSTSLSVVGIDEQGLVERFGVAVRGQPLMPGLHVHWPWPIDRVFRLPVQRVQSLTVGHEGEEEGGPENVLWTVQHAPNEYTLVLGNGRDLITVDATVQYRIADPRAWRYNNQNPADALRAIAYRAVMRNTVNRTLADALSENIVTLAHTMRAMVQQDADALGLGIYVENFTVGGMHPPVPVASEYEAVVSAQLAEATAIANAQTFRNQTLPEAESSALVSENQAEADGAKALATAAGEAWGFRAIETQYLSSPEEYFFRRRLETLENDLAGRRFTIVDSRIQRDGGELWLTQ